MAYSLEVIQKQILEYLQTIPTAPVFEDYIPDGRTLRRNAAGDIDPYFVVQFGDEQPSRRGQSMVGPQGDDHELPIYVQAIAGNAALCTRMATRMTHHLLGMSFPWTGNIRKKAGFNMFTIDSSTGATEAYAAPRFFAVTVPIQDIEE